MTVSFNVASQRQGIRRHGPASPHAPEQGTGVDPRGLHPSFDPHHGGGTEVQHGPLGLLVGLAAPHGDESGTVVPGLDVIDGECRYLRNSEQCVAHDRDQGRIPQVEGLTATLEGEADRVGALPGDAGDLAASTFGGRPGETAHGLVAERSEGIVESPMLCRPPHRGDGQTSHGRGSSPGVEVPEVARQGLVDDGASGAPGFEPLQRGAVVPEGVGGHRMPDQVEEVLPGSAGRDVNARIGSLDIRGRLLDWYKGESHLPIVICS